jgi:drug/metabolite transporter (DMT)-like permease
MLAVSLALGACTAWGAADFFGGLKSRTVALLWVMVLSQSAGLALVGVMVAARAEPPPGGGFVLQAMLAGIGGAFGLVCLYRAMAVGTMSVVAPISATGAALPLVVGIATGDRPSFAQGAGILLALGGVALASREAVDQSMGDSRTAAGVGLALLAALGFGCFFVAIDAASDADVLWANLVNRATSLGLGCAAVLLLRPQLTASRVDLPVLAMVGLLEMGANILFAAASTHGLVSVVAVLASLYPVVTVVLARLVLHERLRPPQQAGVAAALAGVALISAG